MVEKFLFQTLLIVFMCVMLSMGIIFLFLGRKLISWSIKISLMLDQILGTNLIDVDNISHVSRPWLYRSIIWFWRFCGLLAVAGVTAGLYEIISSYDNEYLFVFIFWLGIIYGIIALTLAKRLIYWQLSMSMILISRILRLKKTKNIPSFSEIQINELPIRLQRVWGIVAIIISLVAAWIIFT